MSFKRGLLHALLGLICPGAGAFALFCLYAYGQTTVEVWHANDRSLLFWYLPFLFGGVISAGISIAAGFALGSLIKRGKAASRPGDVEDSG